MRMRSRLVSITLLCLLTLTLAMPALIARAAPAPAAPAAGAPATDISKFINEQTVLAIDVDLTKLDGAAIAATLMDLSKAAGITGAEPMQMSEAEAKQGLAHATGWINDAKAAGAKSMFIVMDSAAMQRTGPTMIIPVPDDKAAAIAKMIPTPGGPPQQQQGPGRRATPNMPQGTVVPGVGVVWALPAGVSSVKAIKPAPRAELTAAFKAAGAAPIKLAFALDDKTRQEMVKNLPPMIMGKPTTLITKDFQWASVAATAPPNLTLKGIAQSTDAATAKSTDELIVSAVLMNQKNKNSKLPDELITLITPHAQGNQLVVNLDAKQVNELAVAMKEPMARSRQVAKRVQSASNIRQLLQTCLLFANENKGKYPEDFKALQAAIAKYSGANPETAKRMLTNPRHPEIQPGYIYVKPPKGNAATADTVVIYESHKDFGDGINVGFGDGHVEWVGQKQQFEQMLAKMAQDQ
jgi:prepilin-type processing-associated H-X9-DG protein